LSKIKISISPATAVFILIFTLINFSPHLIIAVFSALLHETGHIIAALTLKIRISEIVIYPFGADIKIAPGQIVSYKTDIFIKSAGIIANVFAVILSWLFLITSEGDIFGIGEIFESILLSGKVFLGNTGEIMNVPKLSSEAVGFFIVCNLGMALINSIPIKGLDGGEIISSVLLLAYDPETVIKIMKSVSFVFIMIFWIIACYYIMFFGTNFNLFIISLYLFSCVFIKK